MKNINDPYLKLTEYLYSEKTIPEKDFSDVIEVNVTKNKKILKWFIPAVKKAGYVKLIEPDSNEERFDPFYVLSMRAYLNYTQEKSLEDARRQSRIATIIAIASIGLTVFLMLIQIGIAILVFSLSKGG